MVALVVEWSSRAEVRFTSTASNIPSWDESQCSGPLAGHWCRCYIAVEPAHYLEVIQGQHRSTYGSNAAHEYQVFGIFQDLFQEEAVAQCRMRQTDQQQLEFYFDQVVAHKFQD